MIIEAIEKRGLYNFDQLNEIAAGNMDFIKSLAAIFIKTSPYDSGEMLEATNTGDWQKVSKYAHKLKSTVDSMNIVSIKSDIRILETDAKSKKNTGSLGQLASKVDRVINEVAEQVKMDFDL